MWLKAENPEPYGSFGNGSAMRVSGCGLLADNLEMAERLAVRTAEVTHNHEEGIKGAVAVAGAVWLAKHGRSMDEIRQYAQRHYNMDFTISEIRKEYRFSETCQGSVPQALECFLESTDFDDALRNAVSIGGDSDTIAAIACSIAGPFWGVPRKYDSVIAKLDETNRRLISDFAKACYA
ncbi:MAG: ADP-ribosylglycohydrolase family protein [Victivallaceae bacterium]|nr:ADP-ribosylglycohydrolase family protein [Victivallaceae bacterium]